MDGRLARLIDEAEIARVLHLYCRAMDRCDRALGRAVFAADATADYGAIFQGLARDFVDHALERHLMSDNHQHRLSNILIAVDGDRAGSECYVDARFRVSDDGRMIERASRGRYVDRWERHGGGWLIVARRYLHEADDARPLASPRFPAEGSRDTDDPSYRGLAAGGMIGGDGYRTPSR